MLYRATMIVDLSAMAITLWMAFYLLARGFPSTVTLRMVIVLVALSIFYYGAYNNIFYQVPGTAAWRAIVLVIGLAGWYSLTYQMMSSYSQRRLRWLERGIYILAVITVGFVLLPNSFVREEGNAYYVAHMGGGPPYMVYGIYQLAVCVCIVLNLLIDDRVGLTKRGKYFLVASIFPILSVVYGVIALIARFLSPRYIQDVMIFCGVFILGLSVARHQTLVERRTTLQDFPVTTIAVLGLSAVYAFLGWNWGVPASLLASVVGFVVLTHALYDLVREFLERSRLRREGAFRKQLHQLETAGENALTIRLQEGLDVLCQTLKAPSGLIAVRRGEEFIVTATRSSVPVESRIAAQLVACEDVSRPKEGQLADLAWIAPSFEGQIQVAVVGIGQPKSRLDYSSGDLDLLVEVADQVGTIVSLSNLRPQQNDQIRQLVAESRANASDLNFVSAELLDTISANPDSDLIKSVEEGLRNLPDTIKLGQSSLADKVGVKAESHIERGKQLQQLIMDSIESLKPAEKRPPEPLPRVWYNHAVLYDAYVEGVPNREIMARLYISEGTFNRTRRNAIRGLARMLVEKSQP